MKRALLIALLTLLPVLCLAHDGGPLKFLGIPIDGSELQFSAKLKAKGFTYNTITESYKGQFNGKTVDVYIHTNHNVVDRVCVVFPLTNEDGIREEYNRLLEQFKNTGKYLDLSMNENIPEDDNISYEISIKNKRYQASFYYYDFNNDRVTFMNALMDKVADFFTEEQLEKLKEYSIKSNDATEDQIQSLLAEMMAEMENMGIGHNENGEADPAKAIQFYLAFIDGMRSLADGDVWFMIHEQYGRYQIALYYDNLHNQANGEDL